jgi:hypothetical protein
MPTLWISWTSRRPEWLASRLMTSGVKYDVDPTEVRALAAGLRRVQESIESLSHPGPGPAAELGSPLIAQALDDVGHGWSRARAGIGHQLDLLSRAGQMAAETYGAVDDSVTCALAER